MDKRKCSRKEGLFRNPFSFLDLQLFTDTFLAENVAKEVIQLS